MYRDGIVAGKMGTGEAPDKLQKRANCPPTLQGLSERPVRMG
jgi:hypothetical protein